VAPGFLRFAAYRCAACGRSYGVPRGGKGLLPWPWSGPRHRRPRCPECGSRNTKGSYLDGPGPLDRVLARQRFRCRDCRRHFDRANLAAVVANALVLALFLGGLAWTLESVRSRLQQGPAPRGGVRP
jgi:DNA-directed RNA polymerase subunit RPC12/RpoP